MSSQVSLYETGEGRFYHTKEGNVIVEAEIGRCCADGIEDGGRSHKSRNAPSKAEKKPGNEFFLP